jgi:SM-20-related protein
VGAVGLMMFVGKGKCFIQRSLFSPKGILHYSTFPSGPLISSLSDHGYFIFDKLLEENHLKKVYEWAENMNFNGKLSFAGIGAKREKNQMIRGDSIAWLDLTQKSEDLEPLLVAFGSLKQILNEEAYMNLKSFQIQLARYPAGSIGYQKHRDVSKFTSSTLENKRAVTCVFYLNPSYSTKDGGQLILYPEEGEGCKVTVEPIGGRAVVFLSELEHEVLPTSAARYALTSWFYR